MKTTVNEDGAMVTMVTYPKAAETDYHKITSAIDGLGLSDYIRVEYDNSHGVILTMTQDIETDLYMLVSELSKLTD